MKMTDNDWLPTPTARRSLFWLLPIVLLAGALVAGLLYREGFWVARDQLHFRTDSADGLAKGMAVKLHGFAVGTVTSVELDPGSTRDASVLVKLAIERRFMSLIARGSVISSAQEGLIGQTYLLIKPPSESALAPRAAADGEQLPFDRPKALSEIASDMATKMEPFVAKAGELTRSLADPDGDLRQLIHHTRLAAENAPALTREASTTLTQTSTVLQGIQQSVEQLNARLPGMLDSTQKTLQNTEVTSSEVRLLTERHGRATLTSAQQAAQDAQEVLAGARQRWPLRSLAPAATYDSPATDVSPLLLPAEAKP